MIDGITILSQREMTEPSISAFIIVFFLFTFAGVVISFLADEGLPAVLLTFCGLAFGAIISHSAGEPNGRYEYKVLFEDSVSISQVLEEYEIVNQEGLIYTIIERENEND